MPSVEQWHITPGSEQLISHCCGIAIWPFSEASSERCGHDAHTTAGGTPALLQTDPLQNIPVLFMRLWFLGPPHLFLRPAQTLASGFCHKSTAAARLQLLPQSLPTRCGWADG